MQIQNGSQVQKWVVFCLVFLVLFAAGMTAVQAGSCEKALFLCLDDATIFGAVLTLYCFNGYLFCLKYIRR